MLPIFCLYKKSVRFSLLPFPIFYKDKTLERFIVWKWLDNDPISARCDLMSVQLCATSSCEGFVGRVRRAFVTFFKSVHACINALYFFVFMWRGGVVLSLNNPSTNPKLSIKLYNEVEISQSLCSKQILSSFSSDFIVNTQCQVFFIMITKIWVYRLR